MLVGGLKIPDDLYLKMVIKYIQNNCEGRDGWALMGFPQTLFQANMFETVITGTNHEY